MKKKKNLPGTQGADTPQIGPFYVVTSTTNCSHSCHGKSTYIPGICIIHSIMGNTGTLLSMLAHNG